MTVVTRTTRLANVLALGFRARTDRLTVVHLRLADVRLDFVLAHHAVDDDLQVQLAHTADDRLTVGLVRTHAEGRILLRQLRQRQAHFLLVGLGLRLHREGHDQRCSSHLTSAGPR